MANLRTRWGTVGLALCIGLVQACGQKVDDSKFEPESVPPQKPIDELDPQEQEAFCEEAIEWAGELIEDGLPRLLCRGEGIQAGGTSTGFDVAACKEAERACLAQPPEDGDTFDVDNATCNFTGLEDACGVTVGEFAGCFEESTKLLERAIAETTCERIAAGNVPNDADYQLSASCQAVLDECNSSSTDDNDSGSSGTPPETGSDTNPETDGASTGGETDTPPPG